MALFSCLKEQLIDKHSEPVFALQPKQQSCSCTWSAEGMPASRCCTPEEPSGSSLLPSLLPATQAPWYWEAGREEREGKPAKIRLELIKSLSPCLPGSVPHLVCRAVS